MFRGRLSGNYSSKGAQTNTINISDRHETLSKSPLGWVGVTFFSTMCRRSVLRLTFEMICKGQKPYTKSRMKHAPPSIPRKIIVERRGQPLSSLRTSLGQIVP